MTTKISKLLVSLITLTLEVEGGHKLELKLAWTMRSLIMIEQKLRELGISINILQQPARFWGDLDVARLAIGIWGCANQAHPDMMNDAGLEVIESFLTVDNYDVAVKGLHDAFLESLSTKRRNLIKQDEAAAGGSPNPTPAPESTT